MIRARWFRAEWQQTMRVLVTRLRNRAYTEELGRGFFIDRTRENFIEGRYVERTSYQEILPDPFGQKVKFDRVEYSDVHFTLFNDFPEIELRDAPRSTLGFTSQLQAVTEYSVVISALTVDPLDWGEKFRRLIETTIIVNSAHVSGIVVAPSVSAAMVIRGDNDVRESLEKATGGRRFDLDKVGIRWLGRGREQCVATLSRSGSAKVDSGGVETLAHLRSALTSTELR
jgi:hypothetical protein